MKPVLILEHQAPENLAYLGTWLTEHNIPFVIFNADKDKEFPRSVESYSALAVMGGSMSARDPLLTNKQAEILILQAMYWDRPVIGHCLGGQLMARALGGKINNSPKPEIGWQPITYIDHELAKEWFGENPTDTVIHWHYETFSVPTGATLLASSNACPNQAFSIGKHLAMQFHIEIDEEKVHRWVEEDDKLWSAARKTYDSVQDRDQMIEGIKTNLEKHQATANAVYSNWLKTTEWADHLKK